MQSLPILLLADDRPGHYHLAEGVAAAIARRRPVAVEKLTLARRRWAAGRMLAGLVNRGASPEMILRIGYGVACASLPTARLVISAGGDTLAANVAAARALGAPNIFCGSLRRIPAAEFALVVSSYARHAELANHLVALKPNGFDPDKLQRLPTDPARARGAPPRLAGLLVGGPSGRFDYRADEWEGLLAFLAASRDAHGTRWIVATSPRSPGNVADALQALARAPASPIAELMDFRQVGVGTLPRLFAQVEAVLATEDSSTMISEAVCARLPVVGVAPAHHGFKDEEREYRTFMRDRGWCRFLPLAELTPQRFVAALRDVTPLAENHLEMLASALESRLPEIFR